MAIVLMLGWWYGQGWLWVLRVLNGYLEMISHTFAVGILVRTLFSPWKQIHSATQFQGFLQTTADNAISRGIGFVVRSVILFWALVLSILVIVFGLVSFAIWPFLPLAVFILPMLALFGVAV